MILKIFLIQLLFFVQAPIVEAQTGSISVNFTGTSQQTGFILISVFNNPRGFPTTKESIIKTFSVKVEEGDNSIEILDLPYGEYAISCFIDSNGNKKLDKNWFGIPSEKTGTSNNPPSGSIPSYEDAKFSLISANLALTIQLN